MSGKCQRTTDTRFMKRSRLSTSSELQYLLPTYPLMRRAEITGRTSPLLWTRSVVVYLGLHEFFGESVEELQLLSTASANSDSVWRLTQPPLQPFRVRLSLA